MARIRRPADLARLERAAARLSPTEREVFLLSAAEGLRNDAIAARLGITTQAAERHLADALVLLDRELRGRERPWWKLW